MFAEDRLMKRLDGHQLSQGRGKHGDDATEYTGTTSPKKFNPIIREGKAQKVQDIQYEQAGNFVCLAGVFDWAASKLMEDVKAKRVKYQHYSSNGTPSDDVFREEEIFELISMVKANDKELDKYQFQKFMFNKAFLTLSELMTYMNQATLFPLVVKKYTEVNLENAVKLLMRCKQLLIARRLAFKTLQSLLMFEYTIKMIRNNVDQFLDG